MTSNLCSRVNNGSCLAGYAHTQCFQKPQVDILFTCFCDSKGIIHRELVRKGETITGKYYLGVMQYLWWIINRILGQNVKSQEAGTQCTIIPLLARPLQYVDSLSVCGTNKQTKKKTLYHPTSTVFIRFVTVQLSFVPKIEDNNERNILQWCCSHVSSHDKGQCGSLKDRPKTIHALVQQVPSSVPMYKRHKKK